MWQDIRDQSGEWKGKASGGKVAGVHLREVRVSMMLMIYWYRQTLTFHVLQLSLSFPNYESFELPATLEKVGRSCV